MNSSDMTFAEYSERSAQFVQYPKKTELPYLMSGLGAELGEIQGAYAKALRARKSLKNEYLRGSIMDEIGDVLWFCSQICNSFGFSLEQAATLNLRKLEERNKMGTITATTRRS